MKNLVTKIISLSFLTIIFYSCVDDDLPVLINEDELITTVEYTLTNTADPGNVVELKSVDPDGDGPDAPVITTSGMLMVNSSYSGTVRFLNESIAPSDDITVEVQEESDEHEVFYVSTTNGFQIAKADVDDNGNPLGLRTTVQTGAAATGELLILLRHEPKKPNDGTLSDSGGETDVQVSLPIIIQ